MNAELERGKDPQKNKVSVLLQGAPVTFNGQDAGSITLLNFEPDSAKTLADEIYRQLAEIENSKECG